jgi:hypothetical protein
VELTGPTSALRREDWLYSMGCAPLFCAAQGIWDPRHVHVIRVASRLTEPFVQQVRAYGGQMATLAPGIHQIKGPAHPCYCVETELVQEPILRLFSPTFLRDPKGVYDLLSEEERAIFIQVYREVEQFKADPQAALKYADYEVFKMSMQEMVTSLLKGLPTEEVLRHYDAQEVLRHYDAQEVLRHYDAQERLKGLPAQERLKGLPAQERLEGLPAQERLEGLPAEEILAGLSPEARERLRRLLSSS